MSSSGLLGKLVVAIVGDNSDLEKNIKTSKKSTESFGKSTSSLGSSLGKLFSGIAFAAVAKKLFDLGKAAENLFNVQKLAETKLDATLIATGSAAGLTATQLKDMASGLQDVTTFGDEATIGAESLLLTFKSIGGDVFPRALESILDVSTAMGQDLKASTVQIGKALNDPIAGLSSLSRVGIQFTDVQKDLIKGFQNSGDLASAQGVILGELESQFGGVARATADTAEGISIQLANALGDSGENIGGYISGSLTPWRKKMLELVTTMNSVYAAQMKLNTLTETGDVTGLVTDLDGLKSTLNDLNNEVVNYGMGWATASEAQITLRDELQKAIDGYDDLATSLERANGYTKMRNSLSADEDAAQKKNIAVIAERVKAEQDQINARKDATKAYESEIESIDALTAAGVKSQEDANDEKLAAEIEFQEALVAAKYDGLESDKGILDIGDQQLLDSLARRAEMTDADAAATLAKEAAAKEAADALQVISDQAIVDRDARILANTEALEAAKLTALTTGADGAIALLGLWEDENSAAAVTMKGLAMAQAGINSYLAFTGALATGIFPWNTINAASVLALGLAQQANIAGVKFAGGGVVAGSSFVGDKVPAMLNSSEMVLNDGQQARLFAMANGGSNTTNNNSGGNTTINNNSMFSLGNDSGKRQAAKALFPFIVKEGQRRGVSLT